MEKPPNAFILFFRVVGEALFLYGLLGWGYGVLIQIKHPDFLSTGLSHLTPWIRVDTFTVLSFILSIIGFFLWRIAKERNREGKKSQSD
jgi:hypothetical protein